MPTFFGMINVGTGPQHYKFEAEDQTKADNLIYEIWLQECESECDRVAKPYVPEDHDDYEPEEI